MEREKNQESRSFSAKNRKAKSNDLKHRLFQIGINHSPKGSMPVHLQTHIGSPKSSMQHRHLLATLTKENSSQLLRYQPSNSPGLIKTHSKDFHIRKNIKFPNSPKNKEASNTLSSFYRPDSVRMQQRELRDALYEARERQEKQDACIQFKESQESKIDEYVNLILKGVENIEQFLYLIRGSEENIYQLELVNFEAVRAHEGEPNFEYYTISRKGFCRYVGGKPQNFLEIIEWAEEKAVYSKIKALKFFYRFRRWKTLQMWRRTVTRQRRQAISHSLQERLFLLEPIARRTLLELRKLTVEMEKAVLIIAKNQGNYTLQSFKHCQERARRQASLAVQEFSRQSRAVVRKCFEDKLTDLRESMKKTDSQEKQTNSTVIGSQSPKEGAFQALGFPANMSYSHRSKLRKETGRFLRFSYLVDNLHLSCLTGLYSSQVQTFISRLQQIQINQPVRLRATIEQGKDELNSERMFSLQLSYDFREVPARLISENTSQEDFIPARDIKLKNQSPGETYWIFRLTQYWLSLQPNIDQVLDELTFLLKQGLSSLKCFERWSKHRQMQKYVSVLEEWDDLVSEHWQISENDNLDPLLILDSLDPILSRLKSVLKVTQTKITDTIRTILTELLNAYWQYEQIDLSKLESEDLDNPAETFQQFLTHTSKLLDKVTNELPHRIELGIIMIHVTKVKNILGQKFAGIIENFKVRLPQLVEERTGKLNEWLLAFGTRLREEILNINDYVRTVGVIRIADAEFGQRRDQCNQLAQLYQTMQQFKMDTRKRKDFETVTLKLKDQLDQLLIAAEQNIERKSDLYSKQVLRYHLPMLLKDIAKVLEATEQPKFLKLNISRASVLSELKQLQRKERELIQQRMKCFQYMQALKLQEQKVQELDQLSKQISTRVTLWQTIEKWEEFSSSIRSEKIKDIQISILIDEVEEFRSTAKELEASLPPNEVLAYLKEQSEEYYVYLPLLDGFSSTLSDEHWQEIYETLPEKFSLDLKKRQFRVKDFLQSGVGKYAKQIQNIFEKSRVEAKLQSHYHHLQEQWASLMAKIRVEGRFNVIANGSQLRQELNRILISLVQNLADPHSQSLKQYSITYETLISYQNALQSWLKNQDRLMELQKLCRLLDIKKLPEYTFFENAQRIYKQISKATLVKGAEAGVKLGKLLQSATDDKLTEISFNLSKVQDNIKSILAEHRRVYPSFYLFQDNELIKLITEPSHDSIEQAAKKMLPGLKSLQFQNQRIMNLIGIDGDRIYKNPISTSGDIQQILYQLSQTMNEIHRRTMRACRYKAVENNLTSLVQQYNIQHLLAISRVDFSHYTTISIENQQQTPDSLTQFRKVMRKDTAQDIRNRQFMKEITNDTAFITNTQKYDTLLLQQLIYEQILDQLIKNNIEKAEEFIWASQLKFSWQDTATDETNITVRQLHLSLKYGNDFLGSLIKVVIQSQPEILLGLRLAEPVVYTGSTYTLERLLNAVGYKMLKYNCSPTTTSAFLHDFIIGCYYADYLPLLCSADLLSSDLKANIGLQTWIPEFKQHTLKKNSPYVRQTEKIFNLFTTLRNTATGAYSFGGAYRVVEFSRPKIEIIRSGMQVLGVFGQQKNSLLLRMFELVHFLEERSEMKGVSLQKFLDETLLEEANLNEHRLFARLMSHLKPRIAVDIHSALFKHLENLGLLTIEEERLEKSDKMSEISKILWQRGIIILGGRGYSKKHYLKNQLSKVGVEIISVFGKSLTSQQMFSASLGTYLLNYCCGRQKSVLYVQEITLQLLLAMEKLVYYDKFLRSNKHKIAIVLDIPILDQFIDPHALSTFPIINFEAPKQLIETLTAQWTQRHFQGDKQRNAAKIITDIVMPCFEMLSSKEDIILESKFVEFLRYYQSLLPVKNCLQASVYVLAMMFKGYEEELLKLQYITKKHLGDDYYTEDNRISQLVYSKDTLKEGMVNEVAFHKKWHEQRSFQDCQYIITPEFAHLLTASRRIHDQTTYGIILQGKGNSGKSTHLNLYRQLYHKNSFYLTLSAQQTQTWKQKINSTLNRHGLSILGARINYRQTVIMIEDVHMAPPEALTSFQYMLNYSKWQFQQKEMGLKNVKLLFTTKETPEILTAKTIKLKISLDSEKIKGIFEQLLRQNLRQECEIPQEVIKKIIGNTYDLCCKITQEYNQTLKEAYHPLRRIVAGFSLLKLKDCHNPIKQFERFWAFALQEALTSYDSTKILESQLSKLQLTQNTTALSYTHLSAKPLQRKVQYVRDIKRLYNLLNERIEKYNQGEVKRYGQSFEFLNFDCMLQKILAISHSILLDHDHMLVGRKGAGKESLVKMAAFFNGMYFKTVEGSIKAAIQELAEIAMATPHLLLKKVVTTNDQHFLEEYCLCDLQSQILGKSTGKPRVGVRQRQRQKQIVVTNPLKMTKKDQSSCQTFLMPKSKPTWEQILGFKKSIRIVVTLSSKEETTLISKQIRSRFHYDLINEVPVASIVQYNQKLLAVDAVECSQDAQTLISQLYEYSRQKLGISLRVNDDCVRLFASFLTNLVPQMTIEAQRYGKILTIIEKLRVCSVIINASLCECHSKLKEFSGSAEGNREAKLQIELQLRQKSTALAICQKIVQILSWLQPSYKEKHTEYQRYLQDKNRLQLIFALTASYFIYLSDRSYQFRREVLQEWRDHVPIMQQVPIMTSFLPLFLLYEEQFNAEPVDDLPDFYENMAIIFHSAKPIAIRDNCNRGRAWLEKNCSFTHLKQSQKDFFQCLSEQLTKPTNILIEITEQQTMNKLSQTPIGMLLFLPQSVNTVNLRGEDITVHQQAKVYMLVDPKIKIPKHIEPQFTVVVYEQNQSMAKTAIIHQYLSYTQREHQVSRLDWHRKIRNLKLDCDNAIGQIAESIFQQLCGTENVESQEVLIDNLSKIPDKLMIKAQNQFTKIKEKEEMIAGFRQKYEHSCSKINQEIAVEFYKMVEKVKEILDLMKNLAEENRLWTASYSEYFAVIKLALAKGVVANITSLLLFALRQWGPLYSHQHYLIYALLLIMAYQGKSLEELNAALTPQGLRSGSFFNLINRPNITITDAEVIENEIAQAFLEIIKDEDYNTLGYIVEKRSELYLPVLWVNQEEGCQKLVQIISRCEQNQIRNRLLELNPRILEPTLQEPLESLLKKSPADEVHILSFSPSLKQQFSKTLKIWNLQDSSVVILQSPFKLPEADRVWPVNIFNSQQIYLKTIEHYALIAGICLMKQDNCEGNIIDSRMSSLHSSPLQSPESDIANQKGYQFIEGLVKSVKQMYRQNGLTVPMFNKNQIILLKRSLQNGDLPLTMLQKVQCMVKYLQSLIHCPLPQLHHAFNTLTSKLIKLATKTSNQAEFYQQSSDILTKHKQLQTISHQETIKLMTMELSWLSKTRETLGLPVTQLTERYLQMIEEYISSYEQFKEQPHVERGSKRQMNIKNRKESMVKKNRQQRDSQNITIQSRKAKRPTLIAKTTNNNHLASIILLKESDNYERVLHQIHADLLSAKRELQQCRNCCPSPVVLETILSISQKQPTKSWKQLLVGVGCGNMPLSLALRTLLARRNELYTLYNKFIISDSCELDIKHMKKPDEFIRAFFGSELTTRDIFILTSQLTQEETEGGDYLRINGLFGCGWRLSGEGTIQHLGQNKVVQMGGCFLVRKPVLGLGYCPVDVILSAEKEPFMKLYCLSKKMQSGLKLYLHYNE